MSNNTELTSKPIMKTYKLTPFEIKFKNDIAQIELLEKKRLLELFPIPEPEIKRENIIFSEEMRSIRFCPCSSCAWTDWRIKAQEEHIMVRDKKVYIYISCHIARHNNAMDEINKENRILSESLLNKELNSDEYNKISKKIELNSCIIMESNEELEQTIKNYTRHR